MKFDTKMHGEGQALALREGAAFFHRSAGAFGCHTRIQVGFPRDIERFMKHPQFIMDSETVKRRIYETLRHGYFNDEKDYVDVSNGSGDAIEIVVVSRKFEGYTAGHRIDMILNELCKHLSQVEAGHVLFSIGMLPEEVYIL